MKLRPKLAQLKISLSIVTLTLLLKLVTDHIMRSMFDFAPYILMASIAGSMGLLVFALVKLVNRNKLQ